MLNFLIMLLPAIACINCVGKVTDSFMEQMGYSFLLALPALYLGHLLAEKLKTKQKHVRIAAFIALSILTIIAPFLVQEGVKLI